MIDDGPKRKRAVGAQQDSPAAKKPTLEPPNQLSKANAEETRSVVRGLYANYKTLVTSSDGRSPGSGAFHAVLQAAQGDVASRRLAARLIPRFIAQFPEQVDVAAAALTRLHRSQPTSQTAEEKHLEEVTRQDALNGLAAILQAAQACKNPGEHAVKHVLEYLLRLFPEAAAATDEPSEPEEEGEVTASHNDTCRYVHLLKRLLRQALRQHPTFTLSYCFGCLAAANSSHSSSGTVHPNPQVLQGVRLWLKEHLLRESTPSRESTPLGDGLAGPGAAAEGTNGNSKAAGKVSCLKHVLETSQELQAWIMQQARARATAPPEVRHVLETALQLLPPHAQLAAAKPKIDTPATASRHQQQQRLPTAVSLPNMRHQAQPANGVGFVNGMEPLGRAYSTPYSNDRHSSRTHVRTSAAAAENHQQQQHFQQQPPHTFRSPAGFPQPPGPICRVEPCLLAFNLPPAITKQDVQAALSAEQVWIMEQQHGSCGCASACCMYKSVLDAAKTYLKHNGTTRFGPGTPPLVLMFTDSLPASSKKPAAAEPSNFVWATKDAVGDAESITEDLRTAGLRLDHVHRVNNAAEPGTLLQTPSGQHAASVVKYLLRKHPQPHQKAAATAAAMTADDQDSLPPLPPEPPPPAGAAEWPAATPTAVRQHPAASGQQQQGMPPLPPGPPPPWSQQQQQQQHLERVASAGSLGRPVSPAVPPGALQQQQQTPGYSDAVGRHRSPASWSTSPSDWQQQPPQQTPVGSSRDHHVNRWGPPVPGTPHGHPQQHSLPQQQQHPWHGRGPGPLNIPGPAPPPGPPPLPPGQAGLGHLGASPGAAGSSGWHTVSPGHTPGHTPKQHIPGPVPPPAVPPGPPPQHNMGRGPPVHPQQQQQQRHQQQGPPVTPGAISGPKPPPNPPRGAPPLGPGSGPQYPPLPPPGRVLWQGSIVKQSVRICGVVCLAGASQGHHPMAGYASEPQHWPEQLHVNFRICVPDAVEQYCQAAPEQRAIRLLLPQNPDADSQQLQQFINYLNGKDRAGMVKLPAMRDQGLGARAVYLVVPKPQVCQQLQVMWDGRDVMLIAVVVPQPGSNAAAVPGGSGHRQHRG